jgi:hypothetical protein
MGGRATGAVCLAAPRQAQLTLDAPALGFGQVAYAGGGLDLYLWSLVAPGIEVIPAVFAVQPGEHTVEILGVGVVLGQDHRAVGVGEDVVLEVLLAADHVVDQPAEERDVGSGPDRHVQVGERAGPGEARIDVDDRCAPGLGLHDPLEPDRMALGHVRAFNDDAIGVLQVLLEVGGPAATEAGSQTGDGGGVSYTGLVLDLDRAESGEQLLDQVVFLVVQGGPAEAGNA